MSDNSAVKAESGERDEEAGVKPTPSGTLKMSFADWKKCKEALNPEASEKGNQGHSKGEGRANGRRNQQRNDRNNASGSGGGGGIRNHYQERNTFHQPLCRPPPMPIQLLSLNMGGGGGFGGNFGPPCGPPMMPPMGMGMGPGPGSGPGSPHGLGRRPRNQQHRPLQPPPFWEDMMSPQRRPPPIQPPMPKCPSLWNLVPKDKDKQKMSNHKYKPKNNNSIKKSNKDAKLMPPPPPPPPPASSSGGDSSSVSSSNSGQPAQKKKKAGGTFVQVNGQWVQKPEAPLPLEEAPPGTKEDRQRQWKEYRQAMKPFKNREFHNWKRTVQRLSKIPREQLDEQQLERLQKAEEYIGAHKAMLTIKHAERWVQQGSGNGNSETEGQQGQVYVRRPANTSSFFDQQKKGLSGFQRATPPKKQFFGTGRAIKGSIGTSNVLESPLVNPPIGQFNQSLSVFGLEASAESANSDGAGVDRALCSSLYRNYSANFVKGDTLLPP